MVTTIRLLSFWSCFGVSGHYLTKMLNSIMTNYQSSADFMGQGSFFFIFIFFNPKFPQHSLNPRHCQTHYPSSTLPNIPKKSLMSASFSNVDTKWMWTMMKGGILQAYRSVLRAARCVLVTWISLKSSLKASLKVRDRLLFISHSFSPRVCLLKHRWSGCCSLAGREAAGCFLSSRAIKGYIDSAILLHPRADAGPQYPPERGLLYLQRWPRGVLLVLYLSSIRSR